MYNEVLMMFLVEGETPNTTGVKTQRSVCVYAATVLMRV